jgi:hypothetical protein
MRTNEQTDSSLRTRLTVAAQPSGHGFQPVVGRARLVLTSAYLRDPGVGDAIYFAGDLLPLAFSL